MIGKVSILSTSLSFLQPKSTIKKREKLRITDLGSECFILKIKVKKNLSLEEDRFF